MSSFCAQKKNKETGGPISSYPDDAYRSCIGRNDGSDTYGIRGGKKKTRYGETGRLIGSHAGINVDYQIKELCRSVFFLFLTCSFSWPSGYELDLEITGKMADQRESPPHFKKLARPLSVFPFFLQCD